MAAKQSMVATIIIQLLQHVLFDVGLSHADMFFYCSSYAALLWDDS